MNRKLLAGLVAASLWGATALCASAADPILNELYGRGVHAFNAGKYDEAATLFTEAIDQGSSDPRVRYFRGLVFARSGRPEQAEADFQAASKLEATSGESVFNIGKALEKVQGAERMDIERHRRAARIAVAKSKASETQSKYEAAQASENRVIRTAPSRTGEVGGAPAPAVATETKPAEGASPFDGDIGVAGPAEKSPEKPMTAAATPAGEADPFAPKSTGTKPAAAAESDPFGEEGAAPVAPKPAKPATTDPFGGEAAAPTPKPAKPAVDDPFGDSEPAPKPMPKPVAPAEDDPFGATPKPADPAAEDPFGAAPKPMPPAPKPAPPADEDPFGAAPKPMPKPADPAAPGEAAAGGKKRGLIGAMIGAFGKSLGGGPAAKPMVEDGVTPPPPPKPAPPAAEDPFDAPPPKAAPAGEDPFGAAPPKAAPAVPAPASDDPFDAAPSPAPKAEPKPADDDPFKS